MQQHPRTGLVTGNSYGTDGETQSAAYRHFTPFNEFIGNLQIGLLERIFASSLLMIPLGDEPVQAEWLSGASLMIRREVFADTGLMDEDYFLYFEETDLCLRARRKGWELWYVPASRVMHIEGAATGFTLEEVTKPRRARYWFESRHRFFLKNYGPVKTVLADTAHMLGYSLWRIRRRIQNKPDYDPPHYLKDFFVNSVFVRGFSIKR
jgi:GT2 family glycosyltransferase